MENQYELKDGFLRVRIPKELDHHSAIGLRAETDMLIRTYHVRHLIFDFSRTEFMDSSGIGIILGRYKKISCFGGRVYAVNVDNRIRRILLLSGLENIVEIME